jgi:hypothetical protein
VTIPLIAFSAGLALLIVAVLGGGIEIKEVKIPSLAIFPRVLSGMIGGTLLGICIFYPNLLPGSSPLQPVPAVPTPPIPPHLSSTEPVYTTYSSGELGAIFPFPNNVLSLDTTEREQRRLTLREGNGQARVRIMRSVLPEIRDIKLGRRTEKEGLERLGYTLTYVAPEREENWKDWYVLSGLTNNTVFYYRRRYLDDSVGSIEFSFPKELGPLYDKIIASMTQGLVFTRAAPKLSP